MSDNPLRDPTARKAGRVTTQMLHDMVERYNKANFVVASGKWYFVNKKSKGDGTIIHFLDREI